MSGYDFFKIIKFNVVILYILVVMFFLFDDQCDINQSYEFGVNGYVVKFIDFKEFMGMVVDIGIYWCNCNCLVCGDEFVWFMF